MHKFNKVLFPRKKGIDLPGNGTLREMKDKIIVKYPKNLQHYLEPFGIFSPCFV